MRIIDSYSITSSIIRCFSFLLLVISCSSANATESNPIEKCELTFGWTHYPPYQMSKNGSIPHGMHIDLIKAITEEANCSITYVKGFYGELVEMLKQGEIDFVADASITEGRKDFAYFSEPYRNEALVLYVKKRFAPQCENRSLSEIFQLPFRIGVTKGVFYGEKVKAIENSEPSHPAFIYAKNRDELIHFVELGVIDGYFEDPAVFAYETRTEKRDFGLAKCKLAKYSPVSIMFSKKNVDEKLVQTINKAIAKVKLTDKYKNEWGW